MYSLIPNQFSIVSMFLKKDNMVRSSQYSKPMFVKCRTYV
uniref:Uncharacterized protein n=1 Tax=Anguilla anguilla TaxID=7936 RepID=A0A0E9XXY4_ANGAN